MNARKRKPQDLRHRWRVQTNIDGGFDEIVVRIGPESADGLVLHAEMMDERSCFVDVAGFKLWVYVTGNGVARITMSEDNRPCAAVCTGAEDHIDLRDPELDQKPRRRR